MTDHDPLCPTDQNLPSIDQPCWFCDLIARIVERERKTMSDRLLTLYLQLGDMLNDYSHAEAVAAKLVEVICENAESEAWLENSNQQLRGQITQSIQNGYKLRRERDAALAEVAALREQVEDKPRLQVKCPECGQVIPMPLVLLIGEVVDGDLLIDIEPDTADL